MRMLHIKPTHQLNVLANTLADCDPFLCWSLEKVGNTLVKVDQSLSFVTQITLRLWFTKRIALTLKQGK